MAIVLAVVASGCGGDDGSVLGPGPADSDSMADGDLRVEIDPGVMTVAQTIVARLGPGRGFDAVALALDAGYGVGQIADGGAVLKAEGTIPGVEPSGARSGLFALLFDNGVVLAAGAGFLLAGGDDLEFLRARFRTASSASGAESEEAISAFMVGALLHLVAAGYSLDQIVEGIVFQEVRLTSWNPYSWNSDFACFALAADDGTLVAPAQVPPAWEIWEDADRCHQRIWDGDIGFFVGCENDAYGICTGGEAVTGITAATTTTTTVGGGDGVSGLGSGDPATGDADEGLIPDGLFLGDLTLGVAGAWEIEDGIAELTVADGTIETSVEFSAHGAAWVHDNVVVCSVRLSYVFEGSSPIANPLVLVLEPRLERIDALEGPRCGEVGPSGQTPEERMRAAFGAPMYLEAEYREGRITGTFTWAHWIGPLDVEALQY